MILGLDVSTSITGASVIDESGCLLFCGKYDTRKIKGFYLKADFVEENLKQLKKDYDITHVYIEQPLGMFKSGFSSAKTIQLLNRYNGVISWICRKIFKTDPELVNAMSARKLAGIKFNKGDKAKEIVLKFVLDNDPLFDIKYTRNGTPKPGEFDRADSVIIARQEEENSKS